MAKTIEFDYKEKSYVLEFTRRSVQQLEKTGFNIMDMRNKPASTIPDFFAGAFLAHHRHLKRELIDEIFDNIENKEGLIEALSGMYNDTLLTLIGDDEEQGGNISWKAV